MGCCTLDGILGESSPSSPVHSKPCRKLIDQVAEAFGISQYQVASSAVAAGLSPGATIGAVALGHFLVACANAANGYVGCVYGINFPVFTRASFGQRGVFIALICRSVAAIVWAGTQTYQVSRCLDLDIMELIG